MHLKKWFADYKNKYRPESMKNGNFKFLLLFLSDFRPCILVKLQYCRKYEMQAYTVYGYYFFAFILIKKHTIFLNPIII